MTKRMLAADMPSTQWAAVSTLRGSTKVPVQECEPKLVIDPTAGRSVNVLPPMMRSAESFSNAGSILTLSLAPQAVANVPSKINRGRRLDMVSSLTKRTRVKIDHNVEATRWACRGKFVHYRKLQRLLTVTKRK